MHVIDTEKRPILSGLVALATVAIVVGVLGGVGIFVGVKALGVGGDGSASSSSGSSGDSLYLPKPSDTPTETPTQEPTETPTEIETTPVDTITLAAAQVSVAPMQQIDLSGTYPTGEGAILQVQRFENDEWVDFPVTMSVNASTFATYVLTSRPGENRFRVIDTDTEKVSNEVAVTVG